MRKVVTPAHPEARILDPDHGDFLPAEGREVAFTPYWLSHEAQGNVTVSDPVAPDYAPTAADPASAAPAA